MNSSKFFYFFFFLAPFIDVASGVSICLVWDSSIVATCPSIPAARIAFCFVLFLFFVDVLSDEPKQKQGRGLVDRKLVQVPSNFIAGRPKAALLFWLFGDFRCDVSLFIVILVIYKF